jgi:hypothetical protein
VQAAPFTPSQTPLHDEPSPEHAARPGAGAPETALQVPTFPCALQIWHCPVHAVSQHTSSTQCPVAQAVSAAQGEPAVSFGIQAPPLQKLPAEHCAFVVQLIRQAVAPQTYGAHGFVTEGGQAPLEPVQTAAAL